jgi:ABC-2 type transport system permease protein
MNTPINAAVTETRAHAVAAPHPTHKLKLLLKREFWEHKGGFFWAPIVAGGISLLLTVLGIVFGEITARRAMDEGKLMIDGEVVINGLDLGALTGRLGPEEMEKLGKGIDLSLFIASSWPFLVLGFVVFFYCLGALYDDRKDRSVLFWKSLPISDRDTVASKGISALLVAPLLAVAAALATMIGFMLIVSLVALIHGGNPITLLWGPGSPLSVVGAYLIALPVYMLWALPTVGWLLLCSAWARSKPFLWAIMIPVFSGVFVSWFDLAKLVDMDSSWYWAHVVGRLLLGTFPGIDIIYQDNFGKDVGDFDGALHQMSATTAMESFSMPETWIGAVAGLAMIYGAIRLRRWRDEG